MSIHNLLIHGTCVKLQKSTKTNEISFEIWKRFFQFLFIRAKVNLWMQRKLISFTCCHPKRKRPP